MRWGHNCHFARSVGSEAAGFGHSIVDWVFWVFCLVFVGYAVAVVIGHRGIGCRLIASALDGDAAGAALKMIRDAGRAARRTVPARILITQTDAAIVTTSHKELLAELDGAGVERLQTELMRRAPFQQKLQRPDNILKTHLNV